MKKMILGITLLFANSTSRAEALNMEFHSVGSGEAYSTASQPEYFPTESEWEALISEGLATGEITEEEVISYEELEVSAYKWKDRRESSNVEDRRNWRAKEWLWWATTIGQY